MEKLQSATMWRTIGEVAVTVVIALVYVGVYASLLVYAASHTDQASYFLWAWSWIGLVPVWVVAIRVTNVHQLVSWKELRDAPFWITMVMFALGVWHLIGAAFVSAPEGKLWFAYAPVGAAGLAVFMLVIRFFMEAKKRYWSNPYD